MSQFAWDCPNFQTGNSAFWEPPQSSEHLDGRSPWSRMACIGEPSGDTFPKLVATARVGVKGGPGGCVGSTRSTPDRAPQREGAFSLEEKVWHKEAGVTAQGRT